MHQSVTASHQELSPAVLVVPATVPAEQAESGRVLDEVATAAEPDQPDSSTALAESAEAMVTTLAEVPATEVPAAEKSQDRSVQEIGGVVAGAASKSDLRARSTYKVSRSEEPAMASRESLPEFPGGNDSLTAFIRRNLQYPPQALAAKVEGTVIVTFLIDQQGQVSQAQIIQGIGSGCDEAVFQLIELMPAWIPAKYDGKAVRLQYNLPIQFKLPD
jgi:protein TonB